MGQIFDTVGPPLTRFSLLWIQWDGTVQLFGTKGQKFLHCPGTKGQRDKLKILPRDGPGRDFDILPWDGPGRDKILTFCQGTGRDGILPVFPVPECLGTATGQKGKKCKKNQKICK